MKAWEIGPHGGIDSLRLVERAEPQPGPGEVLVRVKAAGLNYRDLMVVSGQYSTGDTEHRIPLSDGVGLVETPGDGVNELKPGTRVIAPHFTNWLDGAFSMALFGSDLGVSADGWLAQKMILPASACIAIPDTLSDSGAATLAVAGGTVWHAMVEFGQAKSGSLVLAQGTGGVAIFALQLAKALGCEFAITSSSDEKLAHARALGADYTVNYRNRHDWATAILEQTGGRGVDVVVDTLGFSALEETITACAVEARIGTVGALSGTPQDHGNASQGALIAKNIAIKGIASGSRRMLEQAMAVMVDKKIQPVVEHSFPFADAPAAYRHLESRNHFGKVVILPNPRDADTR
ncbi:MAG: zinc-dependent alcohol dehydrogenase family protein [Sphingomonadaceae bacterium]